MPWTDFRPPWRRALLFGATLAIVVLGAWLSRGYPPRLTALNAALRVSYPWQRGAGAILAAIGLVGLAVLVRMVALRVIAALLALVSLGVGVHLLTYRLEAGPVSLVSRVFFGRTTIAWSEVLGVGSDPTLVIVSAGEGRQIHIDMTDFSPEVRATIGRTIARRVEEHGRARPARPE